MDRQKDIGSCHLQITEGHGSKLVSLGYLGEARPYGVAHPLVHATETKLYKSDFPNATFRARTPLSHPPKTCGESETRPADPNNALARCGYQDGIRISENAKKKKMRQPTNPRV